MPAIPPFVLKKLYVKGSLQSQGEVISLRLKNVIAPGTITGIAGLALDTEDVDLALVSVKTSLGDTRSAPEISRQDPLQFPIGSEVSLKIEGKVLASGAHQLVVRVLVQDVGPLEIPISDALS